VKLFLVLFSFLLTSAYAEVDLQNHELAFEYGFKYHTVTGIEKSNNSKGQLSTPLMPYYSGSYTVRITQNIAWRFFGGIQFAKFLEPKRGTLKNPDQIFNHFGVEHLHKAGPYFKWGVFLMQQDHPIYKAASPTEFEVVKLSFAESGLHLALGQRRRIGLLWGIGVKGFTIFPTKGGDIATETGVGGEAYARLGWVGPLGTLYQLKGFAQKTTAPNSDTNFTHSILGYCLLVSHSF
jgi:hypothetical protein